MKGLDYSKFKKVASDKDSTTLKHRDGHELKIAHKGLSDKHRDELHRLPMAKGGEVKYYAGGTGEVKADTKPEEFTPGKDYSQEPLPADPVASLAPPPAEAEPKSHDKEAMVKALKGQAPYTDVPEAGAPAPAPVPQATPQAPPAETQPGATSAILGASQPAPETPKQELKAEEATKSPAQAAQDTKAFIAQERANFQRDMDDGHITPHQYGELFDRKDTLGKISSVFGLILSGASSVLAINPRPLMNFMDREIERDLSAQTKSNENAQNWYRLHQQNLKNLSEVGLTNVDRDTKSYALSKDKMFQASLNEMARGIKQLPDSDPRKAPGNQLLAMMHPMIAERSANAATIAASAAEYQKLLFGGNQPSGSEAGFKQQVQGLRMLGPMGKQKAEELESKHYPGFKGQASLPLSESDREKFEKGINFDQQLDRFTRWTKKHSGALNPVDIATGSAMAAELSSAYRDSIHGGVFKPGEQSFIGSVIDPNPTKFFNAVRVIPKLEVAKKNHLATMHNLAKSKGFEEYNPGTSAEEETKIVNGVKYKRGPNGEAVRVQ